jgi:CheY-like chemotaxis protein/HPt (histidine-containing phosphotransfer) domain-containing protein
MLKPVRQLQLFDAVTNALQCVKEVTIKPDAATIQVPKYPGKKVLVVEDNKINQKVIVAKLAKFDIVSEIAENGQVALTKLAHNVYDLILMDCQMPVMDGYTATRELRRLETGKGLPHQTVIALTANALEDEREKCLAAGMDDYLAKPIISEQLMAILACRLVTQQNEVAPGLLYEKLTPVENNMMIWNEAAALKQLGGDSDLLDEMIELFLLESPKQLSELSRFQAEGDLLALADTAHAIKGTITYFCADKAKEHASVLEKTARSGASADFHSMTDALIGAVTDLMDVLSGEKFKYPIK